jgi:hypothetical protein
MKLDNIPEIDSQWYDPDYVVSLADIAETELCKQGYCSTMNESLLKAVLHLMGIDIHREYYETSLGEASYRSPLTDNVQKGGNIFVGYERCDPAWKKNGYKITRDYLFGSKLPEVVKLLEHKE